MAEGRRTAEELAEHLARRAVHVREADRVEEATERHLDAVLLQHGCHCLHDCSWPGSRHANIDHVVIGPSGVWVIEDVHVTGAITVTDEGEVWTGEFPMSSQLAKGRAQADAVRAVLGTPTTPIVSVHGASVPGNALERDGVVIAGALVRTGEIIVRAPARLSRAEVDRLAMVATRALMPRRLSNPATPPALDASRLPPPRAPQSPLHRVVVPDAVPPWMVREPIGPPPAPSTAGVGRRVRTHRVERALVRILLAGAIAAAGVLAYRGITDALSKQTKNAATVGEMTVAFECRVPGQGWSEVVRWSGKGTVETVTWTSNPGGLAATTVPFGATAVRDGVAPKEHSFVTLRGTDPAGQRFESSQAGIAPAEGC